MHSGAVGSECRGWYPHNPGGVAISHGDVEWVPDVGDEGREDQQQPKNSLDLLIQEYVADHQGWVIIAGVSKHKSWRCSGKPR